MKLPTGMPAILDMVRSSPALLKAGMAPKIFCLSFQRTGTTSVGRFFKEQGFRVATYHVQRRNHWSIQWSQGKHEAIFRSRDFLLHQVFEDDPWWFNDFYKVLFQRFPNARFILFERDADRWFDSMVSHSGGKTLGNTHLHAALYRRDADYRALGVTSGRYVDVIDNLLPLTEEHRDHYQDIYRTRNAALKEFFDLHAPERLFRGRLEDPEVWHRLGAFFDIDVPHDHRVHFNASAR